MNDVDFAIYQWWIIHETLIKTNKYKTSRRHNSLKRYVLGHFNHNHTDWCNNAMDLNEITGINYLRMNYFLENYYFLFNFYLHLWYHIHVVVHTEPTLAATLLLTCSSNWFLVELLFIKTCIIKKKILVARNWLAAFCMTSLVYYYRLLSWRWVFQ